MADIYESFGTFAPPAAEPEERFEDRLVRLGRVSSTQLSEALLQQPASGKRIGNLLVELGALDERDLAAELALYLGLPTVDLRQERPDPRALQLFPEPVARTNGVLPLHLVGDRLQIAVADPLDPDGIDRLAAEAGRPVDLLIAPASDIRRAIETSYRALVDVDRLVEAFEATDVLRRSATIAAPISDDAPVVQLVSRIVTQALRDRASDIHIEPQDGRVRVRYRIDGALHDVVALPENMGPAVVSRLKIMGGMNIADRRRSQDGQIALDIDGRPVDVRINTCPTVWGEKAVLRILDRRRLLYRLDDLGMRAEVHASFSQLVRSPFGMVICAGPTGSGKTTTLYATLAEVNRTERNVTTIEDPVEYIFPSITQIQINEQAGLTFATGLQAILRQDPDVILVGEIRDAETAKIAVESALTGHLVLSSLHATDACSALQRLVDMGIEPFLIASTVIGVAAQRLVRRICRYCRAPYRPGVEELAFYQRHGAGAPNPSVDFYQGLGCNFCARTGYQDRIGVFELVRMDDDIKRLLIERAPVDALRASARDAARSLVQEALDLVAAEMTTISEIMRSTYSG